MILVSGLGIAAGWSDKPDTCLVSLYACFVMAILAVQIGAAVVLLQYSGTLVIQNSLISADLTSTASIEINNGVLSAYTACCSGCPLIGGVPYCNNAAPFFANITTSNCANQTNTVCQLVPPCSLSQNDTCYQYPPSTVIPPPANLIPAIKIDKTLCTILSKVSVNGTLIAGPSDTGACGGGDPAKFQQDVNKYFSDSFYWVAIGFCVIAGIQALVILISLSIMICKC
jgi:hypothetical protein